MIEVCKYSAEDKSEWDNLITHSRNGTFLLYRDYMDYHHDRLSDHSFIVRKNGRIEAVIPGNMDGSTFYSHQGLTYGGLVSSININTKDVLEIFKLFNMELKKNKIKDVIYKLIPFIYHKLPCQEDIYALYANKAERIGCNISTTISLNYKIPFKELRRRGIQKSKRAGISVFESDNLNDFWKILTANLEDKYNKKPTHSFEEITRLKNRFPNNIRLFVAEHEGIIIGGVVLFITSTVVHVQYIGSNDQGRKLGALDLIFDELINRKFPSELYFDFGVSTEHMGKYLNENLIFQKEGYGGRGVVYEIYRYEIP